jgi:hypothetical protein
VGARCGAIGVGAGRRAGTQNGAARARVAHRSRAPGEGSQSRLPAHETGGGNGGDGENAPRVLDGVGARNPARARVLGPGSRAADALLRAHPVASQTGGGGDGNGGIAPHVLDGVSARIRARARVLGTV